MTRSVRIGGQRWLNLGGFPMVRRQSWMQLMRGVLILQHLGTPEALAILKDMVSGHPDVLPTGAAKKAVASLTQPPP